MSSLDYDYIVVGAGVNGSWAAYHLAQRRYKVLLVDRVTNIQYML